MLLIGVLGTARSEGGKSVSFPRLTQRHVLMLCLAYFAIRIAGMLAFQIRWTPDVAIFGSFWEAGKHLDYAIHPYVWVTRQGFAELNMNPPALLPLFQLFALFDPQIGQSVWLLVSAAIYLLTVISLKDHVTRAQLFWLLTVPMVYTGIGLGQIYVLMIALGVAVWWCLRDNREIAAAVLIGVLVAMKPNFAVWGLLAFAAGHFRAAVVAGLVAFILSALPAALYGPDIFSQWLAAASGDNHGAFPHDVSLWGYFSRLGIPGAQAAIAATLIASIAWAVKFRPSLHDLTPVAILVGMLCSPLAWLDYLMIAAAFIVESKWRLPMTLAAFLLYLMPFTGKAVQGSPLVVALASSLYIIPVLIMLAHFVRRVPVQQERLRESMA